MHFRRKVLAISHNVVVVCGSGVARLDNVVSDNSQNAVSTIHERLIADSVAKMKPSLLSDFVQTIRLRPKESDISNSRVFSLAKRIFAIESCCDSIF